MRISTNVGIGIDRPKTITEIVEEVRGAADRGLGGAWWAERHTFDALTAATVAGLEGASGAVPSYRAMFELEGVDGGADVVVVGDEHHVDEQLRRFADAGTTEFIAVPFGSPEQIKRTLTFLGDLNRAPAGT
jgi:alkanesulfonate monooxygenase SsuD/methylene tetrahydromethanopterin reductase-like flavin-dependent oxidoreductase (luciferase family)